MKQFNLSEYLENPSRKVVTRDGREAIIVCTNADDKFPVVAKIQGWDAPFVELFNRDGIHSLDWDECSFDLFFADEKGKSQSIEIPFGAKDSEFVRDEYYIPEGCEARIEGNKVIIERVQKKDELTEFEKALDVFAHNSKLEASNPNYYDWLLKSTALNLIDLARKELKKEFKDEEYFRLIKEHYKKGKQDALKDLPKWKKATEHKDLEKHIAILEEGKVLLSNYLEECDYYIELDDLKTLPKEE